MRSLSILLIFGGLIASCVPAKKYNELLEKEQHCSSELEKFKAAALSNEGRAKDCESQLELAKKDIASLSEDTARLGNDYRLLFAKYDKILRVNDALEQNYNKLRLTGAKEAANLQADLEAKKLELQKKEDALIALEKELKTKEELLIKREQRVNELEEIIRAKDEAVNALKAKVAKALKGFENKGLTVEEKNGKIYVSLEAKLLFDSGSTEVEPEGEKALVELAKVLESEKDLEIVVEGHTDTDAMTSTTHPKTNWELSVLRSTSVIEIMTKNSSIDPAQLMAAGRSEYHPVDPNDKAKNRRIEIIISPNLDELYQLISE